jgi:hypothetical protein
VNYYSSDFIHTRQWKNQELKTPMMQGKSNVAITISVC